jgi:hypothetical protein
VGASSTSSATFDITVSGGAFANSTNYNISYVAGTLTVSDKTVVEINESISLGKTYDGAAVSYTNADYTLTWSSVTAPKDAGDYTLTLSKPEDPEYIYTPQTVSFTISPKALTVTADDKTIKVGAMLPNYSVTVTGLIDGDTWVDEPTANCSADGTTAGTYSIIPTPGTLAVPNNYAITAVSGTLSITALSTAANVTGISAPTGATISGAAITANVANSVSSQTIALTISEDASWKLYSDSACITEITNKTMNLSVGANTAYIKITAEDGTTTQVYGLIITRASGESEYTPPSGSYTSSTPSAQSEPATATEQTVTVPADNGEKASENVQIQATVKADGGVLLEADDAKFIEVVEHAKETGMITIDVSGVETNAGKVEVTQVYVPITIIEKLAGTETTVEIKLTQGSVTLDQTALEAVAESAAGDTITVIVEEVKAQLNARQQAAVGDRPVYDISIKRGGVYITDFNDGVLTITIPYTLKAGEKPSGIKVYYLDDSGNTQQVQAMYDAKVKCIVFSTTHLSKYYISYEEWVNAYPDITGEEWYFEAVKYVSENGLFHGTESGFEPNLAMTRAMIVTVLYNYVEPEKGENTLSFDDVPPGQWYSDPVAWAASNGIVRGDGNGKFRPNDAITRQEMAQIFFNFVEYFGKGPVGAWGTHLDFADADAISDWAFEAVMWSRMNGVINGEPNPNGGANKFNPKGMATRASAAQMLMNFIENAIK